MAPPLDVRNYPNSATAREQYALGIMRWDETSRRYRHSQHEWQLTARAAHALRMYRVRIEGATGLITLFARGTRSQPTTIMNCHESAGVRARVDPPFPDPWIYELRYRPELHLEESLTVTKLVQLIRARNPAIAIPERQILPDNQRYMWMPQYHQWVDVRAQRQEHLDDLYGYGRALLNAAINAGFVAARVSYPDAPPYDTDGRWDAFSARLWLDDPDTPSQSSDE